jgi:hypothetical protein
MKRRMQRRLTLWAVLALMMGTSELMADQCSGANCATDDPVVSTTPQDNCGSVNCARPAAEPMRTECEGGNCDAMRCGGTNCDNASARVRWLWLLAARRRAQSIRGRSHPAGGPNS